MCVLLLVCLLWLVFWLMLSNLKVLLYARVCTNFQKTPHSHALPTRLCLYTFDSLFLTPQTPLKHLLFNPQTPLKHPSNTPQTPFKHPLKHSPTSNTLKHPQTPFKCPSNTLQTPSNTFQTPFKHPSNTLKHPPTLQPPQPH